jgi:hypothetical protein
MHRRSRTRPRPPNQLEKKQEEKTASGSTRADARWPQPNDPGQVRPPLSISSVVCVPFVHDQLTNHDLLTDLRTDFCMALRRTNPYSLFEVPFVRVPRSRRTWFENLLRPPAPGILGWSASGVWGSPHLWFEVPFWHNRPETIDFPAFVV